MNMKKMSFTILIQMVLVVLAAVQDPASASAATNAGPGSKKGFVLSDFNK